MKRKMFIVLSLVTTLSAQELKTSISEVIDTNPIIQERLKNYNATKEDITNAKAAYYPKLDLSLGGGFENSEKTNLPGGVADSSKSLDVYEASLLANYAASIVCGEVGIVPVEKEMLFETVMKDNL